MWAELAKLSDINWNWVIASVRISCCYKVKAAVRLHLPSREEADGRVSGAPPPLPDELICD